MGTLSTHVLDTSRGHPGAGVGVRLENDSGEIIGAGVTDAAGRVSAIGPVHLPAGTYRLRFDSAAYFAGQGVTAFYPEIAVAFVIDDPDQHYHVPVVINPYGYSTYRGS